MVTTSQDQATAAVPRIERRSEPRYMGHSVFVKTSHAHPMEAYLMDVSVQRRCACRRSNT